MTEDELLAKIFTLEAEIDRKRDEIARLLKVNRSQVDRLRDQELLFTRIRELEEELDGKSKRVASQQP